ncbi:hypothetical protein AAEJ42_13530 [Shewanella algae]|uniref:hypothetical protein n=1 Tax=Shewanella algae TaxID=38313 RepID=UPI00313EF51D
MSETKAMSSVKSQILGLTKTVYSFDYNGQTVHFKLPTIKQTAIFNSENPNYHTDLLIALLVNETGSSIFTEEDRAALEDMPADFSMKLLQAMGEVQNQKKE